jgi:hypothetical protein
MTPSPMDFSPRISQLSGGVNLFLKKDHLCPSGRYTLNLPLCVCVCVCENVCVLYVCVCALNFFLHLPDPHARLA